MVTVPPSTITGTFRAPLVCRSISSRSVADFFTLRYSTAYPLAANASRASEVWGQPSLPKIVTRLSVVMPFIIAPATGARCKIRR